MDALLRRLLRTGTRRGLAGSRPWAIVAIIAATLRMLRRASQDKPDVVWRQRLDPGDRFEVAVHPPDGRARR